MSRLRSFADTVGRPPMATINVTDGYESARAKRREGKLWRQPRNMGDNAGSEIKLKKKTATIQRAKGSSQKLRSLARMAPKGMTKRKKIKVAPTSTIPRGSADKKAPQVPNQGQVTATDVNFTFTREVAEVAQNTPTGVAVPSVPGSMSSASAAIEVKMKAGGEMPMEEREARARSKRAKEAASLLGEAGQGLAAAVEQLVANEGEDFVQIALSHLPAPLLESLQEELAEKEQPHLVTNDVLWSASLRETEKTKRKWLMQDELFGNVRDTEDADPLAIPVFSGPDGWVDTRFRRKKLQWDDLQHPHLIPEMVAAVKMNDVGSVVAHPSGESFRPSVVRKLSHFKRNFAALSRGLLDGVTLENAVIGGSMVLASLQAQLPVIEKMHDEIDEAMAAVMALPLPDELCLEIAEMSLAPKYKALEELVRRDNAGQYGAADIDIFVTAKTKEHGLETVERIVGQLVETMDGYYMPYKLIRTPNAINVVTGAPCPTVQVVLLIYASVEELLCYTDLDCVSLAFDGRQVLASPRSLRALNYRCNFLSPKMSARSAGSVRVRKYLRRGFLGLMFELCFHIPRCDVKPDSATEAGFRAIETHRRSATGPYTQILIHDTLPKILAHLDALAEQQGEVMWLVGDKLAEMQLEASLAAEEEGYDKVESELSVGGLKPLRWKRRDMLLADRKYLPACYMCHKKDVYIADEDTGRREVLMCLECHQYNEKKRMEKSDMKGTVAVVTGGRIKIGYAIGLTGGAARRLLRNGAEVVVTTRFPFDAVTRYQQEADYEEWKDRLHVYGLDMRQLAAVQSFISFLSGRFTHLDILVNNAAQTIRRPPGYYRRTAKKEVEHLEAMAQGQLDAGVTRHLPGQAANQLLIEDVTGEEEGKGAIDLVHNGVELGVCSQATLQCLTEEDDMTKEEELALFPPGRTDEHGEQLDLREKTTWSSTIDAVPMVEMAEVQMVNNIVPFALCQQLLPLLQRTISLDGQPAHIINVSSSEGQFAATKGGGAHPHTNMAKAALNMLTRTISAQYETLGILVNSVDTGWVSAMQPGAAVSTTASVAPLSIDDGAARVLDPIFLARNQSTWLSGMFLKHFEEAEW